MGTCRGICVDQVNVPDADGEAVLLGQFIGCEEGGASKEGKAFMRNAKLSHPGKVASVSSAVRNVARLVAAAPEEFSILGMVAGIRYQHAHLHARSKVRWCESG